MSEFSRLAQTATSQNGINKLKIDCDMLFSPIDLAMLGIDVVKNGDRWLITGWLERRQMQAASNILSKPKNFRKTQLDERSYLFSNGRTNSEKKLLIALVGSAGQFMMPNSIFLQQLLPSEWDVLIIFPWDAKFSETYDLKKIKPRGDVHFYEVGLFHEAAEALGNKIRTLCKPDDYKQTIFAGVSLGGCMAMQLAEDFQASRGLGIGAFLEDSENILRHNNTKTELYAVYSGDYQKDKAAAKDLVRRMGAIAVPIPFANRHNPFKKAIRAGIIGHVLPGILDPNIAIQNAVDRYELNMRRHYARMEGKP